MLKLAGRFVVTSAAAILLLALTPAREGALADQGGWRWLNGVGKCPDPCGPPSWCNCTVPDDN